MDDGTVIYVKPNVGCNCASGNYYLTHLATVDNIITSVRLEDIKGVESPDEEVHFYRIYVVADAVEINVLSVDGDDGNGYYGTGYELIVSAPQ